MDVVMKRVNGFTLIEIVIVILLLAALAVIALPKFINLSTDAKVNVLKQLSASAKTANDQIQLLLKLPSHQSQPSPAHSDRNDVSIINIDGENILLKCGFLDDRNMVKRLQLANNEIYVEYEGHDKAYFGFEASNIKASQCYFRYQQSFADITPPRCDPNASGYQPVYQLITTGC